MKTNFTAYWAAVALLSVVLFTTGCKKPKEIAIPAVVIQESSVAVSYNKAWVVAEVVSDGGSEITERGFCYGKADGALDGQLLVEDGEPFIGELPDLLPSTAYVCKAFAGNEAGRGYSDLFSFTTMSDTIPLVDTYTVTDITYCSAVTSGQVLSGGGQTVEERGICYGTEPLPTIDGMHVPLGSGAGAFECQLTDLLPDTKYYFRAYAVCTKGVYYGVQLVFATKVLPMAVRTISVSDVTGSRVKGEGEVIRDGGYEVTESGFCWGTEHNPTIEGLHIKASIGMGEYNCYFSGLERGRINYVRAYAINEEGVAYGNEIEFVPDEQYAPWPNAASPGLFSVSENRQVRFSQGNLQYYPDDNIWRFAEHQWDFVGGMGWDYYLGDIDCGTVYANGMKCDNTKTYKYYPGWVDLFGWGTSGWNNGNIHYRPYDFAAHVYECTSYGPLGNFNLTGDYAQADWGIYNTISNGGSRQWRTPTADEFLYLLTERITPSGIRFANAVVAGVRGLVVLPDDWNESTYYLKGTNEQGPYTANVITGGEWLDVLDPAGAVFLPACGERIQFTTYDGIWYDWYDNSRSFELGGMWYDWHNDPSLSSFYIGGSYWTATQSGVSIAEALTILGYEEYLYIAGFIIPDKYRCYGCAVRLISDE